MTRICKQETRILICKPNTEPTCASKMCVYNSKASLRVPSLLPNGYCHQAEKLSR